MNLQRLETAVELIDFIIMKQDKLTKKQQAKRDKRIAKKVAKGNWRESQRESNSDFTKRNYKGIKVV